MSIQEIKRLMCEGLDAKVLIHGDGFAEKTLRKAAILSESVNDDIWTNLPKYRLAHLLFRHAKGQKNIEEIGDLLTSVSDSSAHPTILFSSNVLLLAVSNRLQGSGYSKSLKDQGTLIREAVRILRGQKIVGANNSNYRHDLNNHLFNMLELAVYFTGANYEELDGLGLSHSYVPLLPGQPSSVWRIVEENGFSDQLAYPEDLGHEELLRLCDGSEVDLYYILGDQNFKIYSSSHLELEPSKYKDGAAAVRTLSALHQNQEYGLSSDQLLTLLGSSQTDPQVPRHIRSALNALVDRPITVQTSRGPGNTRFSINPEMKIVGLISQKYFQEN